jgi:LemA protein
VDTTQIAILVGAAVLVFWTVGAYNRLVRLRNAIQRGFAPVDEQFQLRQGLLLAQCDALHGLWGGPGEPGTPLLDALRAACQQADTAHARARAYPGAAVATASLRLAEDILFDTRTRVPVEAIGHPDLLDIGNRLAASDATLAFAKRQFNSAVEEYNHAVRQFPTWLIAWMFSFRTAAPL